MEVDPAKMKVVDLRQELQARGLDTKGNKPALVKRLKDALEKELKSEIPDTTIADTSTEDMDSSLTESEDKVSKAAANEAEETGIDAAEKEALMEAEDSEATEEKESEEKSVPDQNGEESQQEEPASKAEQEGDTEKSLEKGEKTQDDKEQKGEKRKRTSSSADRNQRRRSKSPVVKEDEPEIDEAKVLLSWYDSDLHLKINKETLLSAKPYHDGAFGYAWAGSRATHGVSSGKVRFEVKITEVLKFEDISKLYENRGRDRYRNEARNRRDSSTKKKAPEKKAEDSKSEPEKKAENGDAKAEPMAVDSEEKPKESEEEKKAESEGDKPKENTEKVDKSEESAEKTEEEKPAVDSETQENKAADEKASEENKDENEEKKSNEKEEKKINEKEAEKKKKPEAKPIVPHLFRVGWSFSTTSLQLGEDKFSYGLESTGKFVTDKVFTEIGKSFGVNDVVGAYLEITEEHVKMYFTINDGEPIEATTIPRSELPEEFAFFPHVLSKNYAFEVNLGSKEEAWFPAPESFEDFVFVDKAENNIPGPVRPTNRSDCEVLLMFGLPASGKTFWVKEHTKSNPDKKYTVIGNHHLLQRMTVEGTPLKQNYKGRWNVLLDMIQKCLNELSQVAATRRRNYIIDQTNVFPSAQRRKLRPFEGFKRSAVVVVVGDEEQAKRQSLQEAEEGKDLPDIAVLELKANMTLPEKNSWIDEVIYTDLQEEEAKEQVKKFNTAGREAGFGGSRKPGNDRRMFPKRFGRGGRDRNFRSYDRGGSRNWAYGRPGDRGGWNRDRRDNRGYSDSRDWKRAGDRNSRDNRIQPSHNRNRNSSGGGGGGRPSWQSSSGGQWGGQGTWNTQAWGNTQPWGNQGGNWSNQGGGQGQWKYGSSGGGGSYGGNTGNYGGGNWNYYGQYNQTWGQKRH